MVDPSREAFVGVRPPGWVREDPPQEVSAVLDWVSRAEESGFDVVFVGDRLLAQAGGRSGLSVYQGAMLDPFVLLAAMAARTSRVRLAPLVAVIPFRHPAYLAKMAASLDIVSNGRFILGAGAGWSAPELDMFDIPRHWRGAILEEGIEAIRKLWTGSPVTHSGFWNLDEIAVHPRPVQRPGPPVWLGSFAPDDRSLWVDGEISQAQRNALLRIGRIADGWVPLTYSAGYLTQLPPDLLARAWGIVQEGATDAGRNADDIDIIYAHWVSIITDDDDRANCETALSAFFPGTFEDATRTYVIGSPTQVVDQIRTQVEMLPRVDGYLFTPIVQDLDQLSALAGSVSPDLRVSR